MKPTNDCLIIGAGVMGLSLAYELAGHGLQVALVDRQEPGHEASWAGAGILPPAVRRAGDHAFVQLAGLSATLHAAWADQLREETAIDTGFRRCGGLYVARDEAGLVGLNLQAGYWADLGIPHRRLEPSELHTLEPALADALGHTACRQAYLLPDEAQVRNPWHLAALRAACARRGVRVLPSTEVHGFDRQGDRILAARTAAGPISADRFCLAAGAWSARLLAEWGCELPLVPVRGQIVLLAGPPGLLTRIVNEGSRYLVPRGDGHVLIGSTEERVGFDKRTTAEAVADLLRLATELVPALRSVAVERAWAGLRPCTPDLQPYLGAVPGLTNAFVATGHFRSGLQLSPATAVVVGQAIRGITPEIDLSPFSPVR